MKTTYEDILRIKADQKINLPLMKKDLKLLPDILNEDENLITFILSNTKPQGILCLTNNRILYVSKELNTKNVFLGKNVGVNEVSIPLSKTNSLTVKNDFVYAQLTINDGAKTYLFDKLTRTEIDRFKSFFEREINTIKSSEKTTNIDNNQSISDELRSLKKLLDDEIISSDDFEKKKKQLLNI